jgi:Spy/CpxP family protein refolding chaperone
MKKIIACTIVLAVAIQGIMAQDVPDQKRERNRDRHHKESFQQLNLSEDQKAKFKSLNEDFRKQMQDLRKNDNITVKEWKSKMETLRKDHRTKMSSILTSEQKTKLEKSRVERKSRHKARAEGGFDRMKSRLNLTEEQTVKLKQNRELMAEKLKANRENQSLTDEQRKEQARELRKQNRESLEKILTEEQLKRLHEKQVRRPAKLPV